MRYLLLLVSCVAWGQTGFIPSYPDGNAAGAAYNNQVIDATGEKVAFCGTVWTNDGGSKAIRNLGFMFGSAITKAGGSALTASLQDPSTAAGPPMQPDGTQDETVAIPNASITASAFLLTGNLSADRSVSHGDKLCMVVEYDGAGRLGSDSITLSTATRFGDGRVLAQSTIYTASWADTSGGKIPVMLFKYSDGTYGLLDGSLPMTAPSNTAYNSGSATDEYALKFTVPVSGNIDGVAVNMLAASGADFDIVLYSGTTSIASTSIDSTWINASACSQMAYIAFPKTAITAGVTYYISIKPTTANNVTLCHYTVADNAYLGALPQGIGYIRAGRVDAGAWSDTATALPPIRFRFTPSAAASLAGGSFVVAQ